MDLFNEAQSISCRNAAPLLVHCTQVHGAAALSMELPASVENLNVGHALCSSTYVRAAVAWACECSCPEKRHWMRSQLLWLSFALWL
mmetsp:Transcript_54748/g.143015  ORF Transcript_54748/g.143015 Transcript_54748/m.143015 type:complete len:87 (+) Transcript_54748:307-567(+)